jgi:DNA polymerase (family 10)
MNDDKFSNKSVTELLRNLAAAHVLKNLNRFKTIAYEKAADSVEHLSRELRDIWQEGKIMKVPGIGPGIGSGLDEYFKNGESEHFNEILKGIPPSVFLLMRVPGIGPKKSFRLVGEFGLVSAETVVEDLLNVAKEINFFA